MADAFGHALPKEQLGPQPKVLGVFDETEADHGALAGPQLLLQNIGGSYHRETQAGKAAGGGTESPTFPWRPSTIAVCRTLPTCTVTWEPRRKVFAWKSSTMAASNWQQMVGFILGLTSTIPCSSQSETRTCPLQSRGFKVSQI